MYYAAGFGMAARRADVINASWHLLDDKTRAQLWPEFVSWVAWLAGKTQRLRLILMTPSSSLVEHNLTLKSRAHVLPLKFKSPWEWSVSALRAVGSRDLPAQAAAGLLKQLGQPTWQPGSPAGWDDIAASWAAPDALVLRVEAAQRIADRAGSNVDARALAETFYPGSLSETTRTAIARAESPTEGLALLLVSPEFVRR